MSDVNGMTPEEIRADIERKRGEMSRTVDAIQDRFQPDNLKAEAKSLAQDVVSESAATIKEFVRVNSADLAHSVMDSFKRNPVPSALILAGLGWMIYNSSQSSQQEKGKSERYDARYDRNDPSYDRNFDRGYYTDPRYGPQSGYAERGGRSGRAMNPYDNYGQWDARAEESQGRDRYAGGNGHSFADKAGDVAKSAGSAIAGAAEKVTDAVKGAADNVGDTLSDQASRFAQPVADAGSSLRQNVDAMGRRITDTREQFMDQASEWTDEARQQAGEFSQDMQYQMMRAQEAAARALDENLLTFGALALFAGAAIGLALPATRRERKFMGEYSEQFVEKTQQVAANIAQEVKQVAEDVADDVAPTLRKAVADVSDDLKTAGKEVSKELSQGAQKATDTVNEKVKETTGVDLTNESKQGASTTPAMAGANGKSGSGSTTGSPNN